MSNLCNKQCVFGRNNRFLIYLKNRDSKKKTRYLGIHDGVMGGGGGGEIPFIISAKNIIYIKIL